MNILSDETVTERREGLRSLFLREDVLSIIRIIVLMAALLLTAI